MVKTEYGEEPHIPSGFPLLFPGGDDLAEANSNMITTFLAVSILADLDALNTINATRVVEWILSCKAENGGFKPFPTSQPTFLPGWSRFANGNFDVDSYGAGLAYTYAAVRSLRLLGVDISSVIDVNDVRDYVLSCQTSGTEETVQFLAHTGCNHGSAAGPGAYFAVTTLYDIGVLEAEAEVISRVVNHILQREQYPTLHFDGSWPIPKKTQEDNYGRLGSYGHWGVRVLNVTGSLYVLDEPTPIVFRTRTNLLQLSFLTSMSTAGLSAASILAYDKIQLWKEKRKKLGLPDVTENPMERSV